MVSYGSAVVRVLNWHRPMAARAVDDHARFSMDVPGGGGYPSQPSQPSHRRSALGRNLDWDGLNRPSFSTVPPVSWPGTVGTVGTLPPGKAGHRGCNTGPTH